MAATSSIPFALAELRIDDVDSALRERLRKLAKRTSIAAVAMRLGVPRANVASYLDGNPRRGTIALVQGRARTVFG